jgi:hypothetical protein
LENVFGSIKQQHGNCINPTTIQFERTFRKICCTRLFNSGNENCEGDTDDCLLKIITATRLEEETIQASVSPTMLPTLTVEDTDYQRSHILEQNFTRYVCGVLIKKCLGRHSCSVCEEYAKLYQELDDSSLFCYLKAYQTSEVPFGSLQMPPDNFVYYISMMEVLFQNNVLFVYVFYYLFFTYFKRYM